MELMTFLNRFLLSHLSIFIVLLRTCGMHYGLFIPAREPRKNFAGLSTGRKRNARCGNYAFASLVRLPARKDDAIKRVVNHRRFAVWPGRTESDVRAMVLRGGASGCRSGRKGGRTDPAEMRACQRFVARNGGKKENERGNERESIVFWENSPATNRII